MKEDGSYSRQNFLHEAAKIPGLYVPSLYEVSYKEDWNHRWFSAGL